MPGNVRTQIYAVIVRHLCPSQCNLRAVPGVFNQALGMECRAETHLWAEITGATENLYRYYSEMTFLLG